MRPAAVIHSSLPRRTLLLITAYSPEILKVYQARILNFQQNTIPYLAAFAPTHSAVIHVDKPHSPVDVTLDLSHSIGVQGG